MKVQIMTDSHYGNGTKLAEALKEEFSADHDVKIADVKDLSPSKLAEDAPNVLILGGAIRKFMSDRKSKSWLGELDGILKESGKNIKYGTGFLTHALPTKRVQGYAKRYLNKIDKSSIIEKTYSELLTARVEGMEGPIYPEEMEKAKRYVKNFIAWLD